MRHAPPPLRVAVIGAGYWGPNLVRNFRSCESTDVLWVVDTSEQRARRVANAHPGVRVSTSVDPILADDAVDAVVIATPPETHAPLGLAALTAGKHVLIEKPLATTAEDAAALVDAADRYGRVLMCDHTYCYTPAVRKIRELVREGALGEIQYVDSVRINLGLIQANVDVLWDLAPHDLSILDFVLPPEEMPLEVSAHAADPIGVGQPSIGYLTLPLARGGIAHIHVNWLSPTKIRKTIIAGSRKMLVWDDLQPAQRLSLYDKGVDMSAALGDDERKQLLVSYRTGDMVAPALPEREALAAVAEEFAAAIREDRAPLTDGRAGLRVVRTLAAAGKSLRSGSALIPIEAP
jgi:predicted dehydrogenase